MTHRLVFHVGMHKTGTSALQVAFVRNRARLRDLGIHYPASGSDAVAMEGGVVSGNGLALTPFLAPLPHHSDETAEKAWDRFVRTIDTSPLPNLLYSSEALRRLDAPRLERVAAAAAERGVTVEVVAFVRDWAGHALSSYAQQVKGGGLTLSFPEFVADAEAGYGPRMRERIERQVIPVLGPDAVTLIHYDSNRARLLDAFMEHAFDATAHGLERPPITVNRSLTRLETEWMRYVNQHTRDRGHARRVADLITAQPPTGPTAVVIGRAELTILHDRLDEQTAWLNDAYLGGALRVEAAGVEVVDAYEPAVVTEAERRMIDRLIEQALYPGEPQ